MRLSGAAADVRARCRLVLEDGEERVWEVRPGDLPETGVAGIEGRRFTRRRLDLPGPLPPGYHNLETEVAGERSRTLVIVAPETASPGPIGGTRRTPATPDSAGAPRGTLAASPRRGVAASGGFAASTNWAAFLPLYALRTEHDTGIGRYPDLGRLGRWVGEWGGAAVGTLPLLPAFLDRPFDPSPYAPVSRLFWNELFLDLDGASGLEAVPEAGGLLRSPERLAALARLREFEEVDYRELYRLQRDALDALSRAFFDAGGERDPDFARFLEARPEALDYARFRATVEARGEVWWEWPERPREGVLEPGDFDDAAARRHLYAQWLCERQLGAAAAESAEHGVALYLDLPLGAHPDGYDVWRERDSFALGASGGAPPDPFFSGGQIWGFPPLHPGRIRENGYRYVRASLRHHLRHAGVLRIDHVMGLHRLFCIPDGMSGREGVYVRYAAEELYAIVCLESRRAQAAIVGEDLGTVPIETRSAMRRHALRGMHVLPFEVSADAEPALREPSPGTVASLDTHDTATFAGWWNGADIDGRRRLGLLDDEQAAEEARGRARMRRAVAGFLRERGLARASRSGGGGRGAGPGPPSGDGEDVVPDPVEDPRPESAGVAGPGAAADAELHAADALRGCLRFLAHSPAELLVINLEDLWLEERPQNVPGTSTERPNWRRRAAVRLEELDRFADVLDELDRGG